MPTHYKGKTGVERKKAMEEHKASVKKKKKVSDQSKQSSKRAKRRGSKIGGGRPLTAAEERYFSGKRHA